MYDINHGIGILKKSGVTPNDIIIITDASKDTLVAKCTNIYDIVFYMSSSLQNVVESAYLASSLKSQWISYKNQRPIFTTSFITPDICGKSDAGIVLFPIL